MKIMIGRGPRAASARAPPLGPPKRGVSRPTVYNLPNSPYMTNGILVWDSGVFF